MISRKNIRDALFEAEKVYADLWPIIATLRGDGELENFSALPKFQVNLFDALATLEELYRSLKQEEKQRVARRMQVSPRWFIARMRKLKVYRQHVVDMIDIGRALGDAFAWWFYENDREKLAEHTRKQRQKLLPPGIGRAGERAVVENLRMFGEKMMLYHGITDCLRVGDFSLIDLRTRRCVGLVEAKTSPPADGRIGVSLNIVAEQPLELPEAGPSSSANEERPTEPAENASEQAIDPLFMTRLLRQIEEMKVTLRDPQQADDIDLLKSVGLRAFNHFATIDQAMRAMTPGRAGLASTDEGHLFAAVPMTGVHRFDPARSMSEGTINRIFAGLADELMAVVLPDRTDNALHMYTLNDCVRGFGAHRPPLQYWPLDTEHVRRIVLGEVMLVAAYNLAHFHRRLEAMGFALELDLEKRLTAARKLIADRELRLEAFSYFYSDLASGTLSLANIQYMFEQMSETIDTRGGNQRVDIRPVMHRFKPASLGS